MSGFDKEMWADFVIEVQENLEEFEPNLLLLEQEPGDSSILNDCFRNMHSIKGAANYMGFERMATLAHKIETLMDNARSGKKSLDQKCIDALFKAVDMLRNLLKDIEKNGQETLDIEPLMTELAGLEKETPVNDSDVEALSDADLSASTEDELDEDQELIAIFQEEINSLIAQLQTLRAAEQVPVSTISSILDNMIRVVNYMGKEKLLARITPIKDRMESHDSEGLSGKEVDEMVEELIDIFGSEIDIDNIHEDEEEDDYIRASLEEDRELYEIFLNFFKEIGGPIFSVPEEFDHVWANECQEVLDRLKHSASYMDYRNVVGILEEWGELLAEASTNPESYRPDPFLNLRRRLGDLLPGLEDAYETDDLGRQDEKKRSKKSQEQVETFDIGDEALDSLDSAIDQVIDSSKILEGEIQEDSSSQVQEGSKQARRYHTSSEEQDEKVQTVRVDLQKVENLLEDVAELVVLRSAMSRNVSMLRELYNFCLDKRLLPTERLRKMKEMLLGFSEDVSTLERLVHQLQDGVMRIRMLPVSHLFNRYPRMVRDLARRLEKDVELRLYGLDTSLDKQVMDQLADPLQHIIRNAVDHGIESPDERKSLGKPSRGTVVLGARQEGNFVVIEVSDDGRGIDVGALSQKAERLGLVTKRELEDMEEEDIYALMFAPGVSTAGQVSDISGRGVGMDVVKRNIEAIGGSIVVRSGRGEGTKIFLRIPLTLAIIRGLVVKVGTQAMVIPVSSISETFKVMNSEVSHIEGYEMISRRQETLPLIRLRSIFRGTGDSGYQDKFYVVRVKFGDIDACLGVEELLTQQEIVIKPLSDYLMEQPGFAGATILGDGSIALILDLPAVLSKAKGFIKKRQRIMEMQALGVEQKDQFVLH